jgi:hypothetical protein
MPPGAATSRPVPRGAVAHPPPAPRGFADATGVPPN